LTASHPDGKWTLAMLGGPEIQLLQAIAQQLAGNHEVFVFASSSDARELAELAERSRQAESVAEFENLFLNANEQKKAFERLRRFWGDCEVGAAQGA